jgi:hypothetical protein
MSTNPDPERYRKWQIPSPYKLEACHYCDEDITHGQTINIEYENGLSHATCEEDG